MKNFYFVLFILSCASIELSSSFDNDIKIKSDTIEFLEKSNQINFLENVEINSDFVNIKAESAVYDDIKEMMINKNRQHKPEEVIADPIIDS